MLKGKLNNMSNLFKIDFSVLRTPGNTMHSLPKTGDTDEKRQTFPYSTIADSFSAYPN